MTDQFRSPGHSLCVLCDRVDGPACEFQRLCHATHPLYCSSAIPNIHAFGGPLYRDQGIVADHLAKIPLVITPTESRCNRVKLPGVCFTPRVVL